MPNVTRLALTHDDGGTTVLGSRAVLSQHAGVDRRQRLAHMQKNDLLLHRSAYMCCPYKQVPCCVVPLQVLLCTVKVQMHMHQTPGTPLQQNSRAELGPPIDTCLQRGQLQADSQ